MDDQLTSQVAGVCSGSGARWRAALKHCCMWMELCGHGVLWFGVAGALGLLYLATRERLYWVYFCNLLLILLVDVSLLATLKLTFRRPRPNLDCGNVPMSLSSVDKYAFPSGHASRCVALAAYFCYMPPFLLRTHLWYVWAAVVCISRIMMGRHRISDVMVGMAVGLFVFETARCTWLQVELTDLGNG